MLYKARLKDTQQAFHMWITRPNFLKLLKEENRSVILGKLAKGELTIKELIVLYNNIFRKSHTITLDFPTLMLKSIRTKGYILSDVKKQLRSWGYHV